MKSKKKLYKTCTPTHSYPLFLYFCSRREFLGGNTPHITELATVAKSLPHSLRKAYK